MAPNPPNSALPPVSVCIPCYNSADTLSTALDAILSLDYPQYEVILVDDCSTDGSYDIALRYASANPIIRSFRLPENAGVQAARDFATRMANYEWIASTDSDAVVTRDWLRKGASNFRDSDLVGGTVITVPCSWIEKAMDCLSLYRHQASRCFNRDNTTIDPYAAGNNMFFKKTVFGAVGGYDLRFAAGEDLLLVTKAIDAGYVYVFDPEIKVSHPYSPKCGNLKEFVCRNWESHKWRKVMGRDSRLIRNRNIMIASGAAAIMTAAILSGLMFGGMGLLFFLISMFCALSFQAYRGMRGDGHLFLLCLTGALLKMVRRILGGVAILLPGGPSRAGWSKRF